MRNTALRSATPAVVRFASLAGRTHGLRPAPAGHSKAAARPTPSPPLALDTIASRLPGGWAIAFLPDANLLLTHNRGTMRSVRPGGVVSAPLDGVPGVNAVATRRLHDVVLDLSGGASLVRAAATR